MARLRACRGLLLALLAVCARAGTAAEDQLAPALSASAAHAALALPPDVLLGSPEGLQATLDALAARGASDAGIAAAALSALARAFEADTAAAGSLADVVPPLVRAAMAADAPAAMVAAMRAHASERAVAGSGCAALMALARHTATHGPAGAAGAVEASVAALSAHVREADVATACLSAVMNLVVSPVNKGRVATADVPAAVIAAMKAHARDARVARQGCGALNNAAAGDAHNKLAVGKAGGLYSVLSVLRTHTADPLAVEQACGALAVLGMGEGQAKAAAEMGGVELATAALEAHLGLKDPQSKAKPAPAVPRVAAACARALASLAWTDERIKRTAREALAPELLRAAKERMAADAQVVKWADKALEKITDPVVEQMFEGLLGSFGGGEL